MVKLEEKDFIVGNNNDSREALLIREDCNSYIDSILDQIYELDLTPDEKKELGIEIQKEKVLSDSYGRVKFVFGPGNEVVFSRRIKAYGKDVYKTEYELICNGQLAADKNVSVLSGFSIIASRRLFSYRTISEKLNFDQGNEISIEIDDGERNRTQYSKLGFTKKPIFTEYGRYSFEYLKDGTYKEDFRLYEAGKREIVYLDLEGNPLIQPEIIATSFDSFNDAYNSFNSKFMMCRELIDSRLKEISLAKNK